MNHLKAGLFLLCLAFSFSCDDEKEVKTPQTPEKENPTTDAEIIALYESKFYGAKDIYIEGNFVVVEIDGVPDHKSPYFLGTEWEGTMWVNDTRAGFKQAPNNKVA